MIKQHNIFSGKVDLITDPSDNRAKVALALYALQEQAGRVIGAQAPRVKPMPKRDEQQISMF